MLGVALLAGAGAFVATERTLARTSLVSATCNQQEWPDEHHEMPMQFTLRNAGRVPVVQVNVAIYEVGWAGEATGKPSVAALKIRVPAQTTVTVTETVKAPPGYYEKRFRSLGCTVDHVFFADGSELGARNAPE